MFSAQNHLEGAPDEDGRKVPAVVRAGALVGGGRKPVGGDLRRQPAGFGVRGTLEKKLFRNASANRNRSDASHGDPQ
jgi:hypothetical protein